MALPYLDNPGTLDEMTVMELDGLVVKINSFLSQQHNAQGGHTNITADSLIVTGTIAAARLYLKDGVYQRGRRVSMGDWQDVPFNAANFTGNGSMTWTVASSNVGTQRYALVGQTLHYTVALTSTTVGGVANTELLLALPAGYTVAATVLVPFIYQQDVGILTGFCRANPGDTALRLSKLTLANWTLIVANVFLSITCEVTG